MEFANQGRGGLSRSDAFRDVSLVLADVGAAVAHEASGEALEIGDERLGELAGDAAEQFLVADGILQGDVGECGGLARSSQGSSAYGCRGPRNQRRRGRRNTGELGEDRGAGCTGSSLGQRGTREGSQREKDFGVHDSD